MRRWIAGFVSGLVLASAGIATAAMGHVIHLRGNDVVLWKGVTCVAETTPSVACLAKSNGYGVSLNTQAIGVYRTVNGETKRVFFRAQP